MQLDTKQLHSGHDGTLRVWSTDVVPQQIAQFGRDPSVLGDEELEREAGHVGAARRCHLTKDCLRAISVGQDGYLNVWRLESGHQDRINEVSVSNCGEKVLTPEEVARGERPGRKLCPIALSEPLVKLAETLAIDEAMPSLRLETKLS